MNAPLPSWQTAWAEAAKNRDPLRFVEGVLGVTDLEAWQREALTALRDGKRRISIRSGHGVGKTSFQAWLVLYALLCLGPDTKVPIAAGSRDQLRDTIQPEIGKWRSRLPEPLAKQVDVNVERIAIKAAPDEAFAVFRTASKDNPQALAGFHASNLWFLIDEASAVAEIAYEVATGALSTEGAVAVLTGNPTKNSGYFYKTHHEARHRWHTMHVNAETVPRARGHVEDYAAMYGVNSNKYRVRVKGEFPTSDDETVMSLEKVKAAVGRDVITSNVWPVWGVDPGRFGDDPSALLARQGNTLRSSFTREWQGLDGAQLAGRIIKLYNETPTHDKPREICVDVIGIGASCYDMLRLDGSPVREITRGVNVSEAPAISETEHRLRDELWFRGRAFFAGMDCKIEELPDDPDTWRLIEKLIGELTTVTYDFTELGKHKVMSKKEMRRDGIPSPNLADAFLLTLAAGIYPKSNPHRRGETQQPLSWLAA